MNTTKITTTLLLALAMACGGAEEAHHDSTSGGEHHADGEGHHGGHHGEGHHEGGHHEGHEGHGEGHHAHPEMGPALQSFHDAFAVHWHGDRSAAAVCPDAANLQTLAAAAGEENGDAVLAATANENAAFVVSLCEAGTEGEEFDQAFSRFHDGLHGLMGVPAPAE